MDEIEQKALSCRPFIVEKTESSYARRPDCWRHVSEDEWQSFSWQWAHRLSTIQEVDDAIGLLPEERAAMSAVSGGFSALISPHYAALIRRNLGAECPVRRQAVPVPAELDIHDELMLDPLGEKRHSICKCATRRYPDRAMIYTTHECAMRCRHCTRRGRVGLRESISIDDLNSAIDNVCRNENIRDVLISGGDPLSLGNDVIRFVIARLRACDHIDVIRLCTRMVCTLPQRFNDPELQCILKEFSPIYVNTQFNHPFECTVEAARACEILRSCGCILGNQSVLLKGVNDNADDLEALNRWLLRVGCRPYYLFLCDVAQGTYHFRTTIQTGLDIKDRLRGRLSGLGIPHFVVDLPDGLGKVELCPEHVSKSEKPGHLRIRNWFGAELDYLDE